MWFIFALLSAIFSALTSIFAKMGIGDVNTNLVIAIRTTVVLIMSWAIIFLNNVQDKMGSITKNNWIFLILSGLATGISWFFYYKALKLGEVSRVVTIDKLSIVITLIMAFVFLHEQFTFKALIGCVFITLGTLFMVL